MAGLSPDTLLYKVADVQMIQLEDGRLMVRGPHGTSMRPSFNPDDLERILAEVDGQSTIGQITQRLADVYEAADLPPLLAALIGDILSLTPPKRAERVMPSMAVWGGGLAYDRFLEACQGRGWPAPRQLASTPRLLDLEGCDVLVGLQEPGPLRTALMIQRLALRAGVTSIFLSGEAGQLILGPPALAQTSACLGCVRAEPLASSLGDPGTTIHELGKLIQNLAPTAPALQAALDQILNTIDTMASGNFTAYQHVQVISSEGGIHSRHQTRRLDCALCRNPALVADERFLRAALEGQKTVLQEFTQAGRTPDLRGERLGSVCVLGGGTAGYLAALSMITQNPERPVTLIYSSAMPIIGVGEATTPLMPQFLHADLKVDPQRFFAEVQPTLKLGIRFEWTPKHPFNYPFGPIRVLDPWAHDHHGTYLSAQSAMMEQARVPFLVRGVGGDWLKQPEMAYHLDNPKLAHFLCGEAQRRGVQLLDHRIVSVEKDSAGKRVTALVDDLGGRHAHDFYLDCSGFSSLLIGETLKVPFVDFASNLFTDRAWVGAAPSETVMRPYTSASSMRHGWCWDIPQHNERHLGYVFSSAFCSDEEALKELKQRHPQLGPARLIRFKAGRRAQFISGNVAALGNAYGFVEPLESTSLHLLIRQLGILIRNNPFDHQDGAIESLLNRQVNGWWDYLRWFLALHFKFNQGVDSPFWAACRADVDVSAFGELLDLYKARGPLSTLPGITDGFQYPDPLWGPEGVDTLLLGMGVPCQLPRPASSASGWQRWRSECDAWVAQLGQQRGALAHLNQSSASQQQLARIFKSSGPAYISEVS